MGLTHKLLFQDTQWDNALSNIVQPDARLQDVQVACGKRHMRVHLDFGPQPFQVSDAFRTRA